MKVYAAIGAVSAAMSQQGISKSRHNNQGAGYKFRGIDDVLNALSSALVNAGLVILPRCTEREIVERATKAGGAMFNVCCRVEFDLVSTEDGSKHTVCTYGEAMDSADKATNKAMSAAYKYLALLVFCIPTEASPETDADFSTHEVAAKPVAPASASQDMRPQARARRIAVGVAAGDAKGAALALSQMDDKTLSEIWEHLDGETQAKLTAAWPEVAV